MYILTGDSRVTPWIKMFVLIFLGTYVCVCVCDSEWGNFLYMCFCVKSTLKCIFFEIIALLCMYICTF